MSASYSGDPSASSIDLIRFKTGDTGEGTAFILTNEEIGYYINIYGIADINHIMINCLDGLIAKLTHHPSFRLGDWSEERGDMIARFEAQKKKYTLSATSGGMSSGTTGPLTLNWENQQTDNWHADTNDD